MRAILLPVAAILTSCATSPRIDPGLGSRAHEVTSALRRHQEDVLPAPPGLYDLPGSWVDVTFGAVVATDGPMIAVQFRDPARLPPHPDHMLVPISVADHSVGIIGDGIVAARLGDILICRFFPRPADSARLPSLGDEAWLDEFTRPARPN